MLLLLSTCAVLFENTDDILISFTGDQAVPFALKTLKSDDLELVCMISESLALFIQSLAKQTESTHQLAILLDFLSGSCVELKAREQELRYLRAVHAKNVMEAQDARIAQKRFLSQAARRQLSGYNSLALAFNEEPGGDCPDLDSRDQELHWMVGLMNGLQAVLNDLASEGNAKVPLDIALKVGRGASCLDNEQWWGLPNAIQAAIWVSFPGINPAGVDPLKVLEQSMQTGLQQGMRISQVLAARIFIGLGNSEQVKSIIRRHVNEKARTPANPAFKFLDEVATLQLQSISDRLWTEAVGKRTPLGGLGTFWDDPKNTVDSVNIIDIL